MALAGAGLYFAATSDAASKAFGKIGASMKAIAGIKTDDLFKPEDNKKMIEEADKYNESLTDAKKNLKEVGESAKKSGKQVKDTFLASFDEVFTIPEKAGDAADAMKGIGENMPLPELPQLSTPDLPGLPETSMDVPALGANLIPNFGKILTNLKDMVVQFVKDLPSTLGKFFTETLPDAIISGYKKAKDWLSSNWDGIATAIKDGLSKAWTFVKDWLMQFKGVQVITREFSDFWARWGDDVVAVFKNTWNLVVEVFKWVWGAIKVLAITAFDELKEFWDTWGGALVAFFENLVQLVLTIISHGFGYLFESIRWAFDAIKGFWQTWGKTISPIFKGIWDVILEVFETVLHNILNTIGSVFGAANQLILAALNFIKGNWSEAWENIKNAERLSGVRS